MHPDLTATLQVVCGLECDQAAHALLNSPLLPALAARLAALAAAVPPHTEPARLDQIQVGSVLDCTSTQLRLVR